MRKKIKTWFATPKKAAFTVICAVLILAVLCGGGVFAVSAIAESSAIGSENAKNFAFADAGLDPASVGQVKAEFGYEQGQFVYEVEFSADGTEYEYWIKASNGAVVKRELKVTTVEAGETSTVTAEITADRALELALADAGLTDTEATVTSRKLDRDNGLAVYDIEFYTESARYEYEINAATGAVYEKSVEEIVTAPSASPSVQEEPAQSTAQSGSQGAQETPAAQESPAQSAAQNNTQSAQGTPAVQPSAAPTQAGNGQISLDEAKAIALADAGVSESAAVFTKGKLDYDDGAAVYEIEFYTTSYEYEYEIHAGTGAIRDKSVEAVRAAAADPTGSGTSTEYIGTDKAKTIAVEHAGVPVSGVTFSKVKLDREDGKMVYEVEFYSGGVEYEYTIDAVSGSILEYDSERDD